MTLNNDMSLLVDIPRQFEITDLEYNKFLNWTTTIPEDQEPYKGSGYVFYFVPTTNGILKKVRYGVHDCILNDINREALPVNNDEIF